MSNVRCKHYAQAVAEKRARYFTGKPCTKGHNCARFTADRSCVECKYAHNRRWRQNNPEKLRRKDLPAPTRPTPEACELCGSTAKLCLDHDHETGKFRGWICFRCNTAIGKLGDNIAGLEKAIEYLRRAA